MRVPPDRGPDPGSSRRRPPRASDQRGTAAVEFALVLPLVLTITLALLQVGLLVRDRLLVESAARAGARAAAVHDDPALVRSAVIDCGVDVG